MSLPKTPLACTSTIDVDLDWNDFVDLYAIFFSNKTLESYAFLTHQ
jgi:hypothetical protein